MLKKVYGGLTILLVVFSLFSCTTKDANVLNVSAEYGNLLVTSTNFYGAQIFLDHRDTGKITPALLENLPVGQHVVHLFLRNSKSTPDSVLVMVEESKQATVQFEINRTQSGSLDLTTTPDSVRIFLNKLEFGFTPRLIQGLPVGDYTLRLEKSNYSPQTQKITIASDHAVTVNRTLESHRTVLLEHFSNASCPPCPVADAIVEELAGEYGEVLLTGIGYHAKFPSDNDPMYLAAKDHVNARWDYYNALFAPRAFVDGTVVALATSKPTYTDLINPRLPVAPPAVIYFPRLKREAEEISGQVGVRALADLPAGTVLRVALIEDEIEYPDPPGTNGQKRFTDVLRSFAPDAAGTPLQLAAGQKRRVSFSFNLSAEWGVHLTVVAFLQDDSNKEILQSAWTRYPAL